MGGGKKRVEVAFGETPPLQQPQQVGRRDCFPGAGGFLEGWGRTERGCLLDPDSLPSPPKEAPGTTRPINADRRSYFLGSVPGQQIPSSPRGFSAGPRLPSFPAQRHLGQPDPSMLTADTDSSFLRSGPGLQTPSSLLPEQGRLYRSVLNLGQWKTGATLTPRIQARPASANWGDSGSRKSSSEAPG